MKTFRPCLLVPLALGCLILADSGCTKQIRKQRFISDGNRDVEAGLYDKAEVEYVRAIQINKSDPVANRQLGILYFNEGNEIKALIYLRNALQLAPDNADAQVKMATIYLAHAGYKQAADAARKVLAAQPGREDALLLLAQSARTADEIEAARQVIDKARQKDQDRPGYHLALGVLNLLKRDAAGAETEFKKALELDPKSSAANLYLGDIYLLVHRDRKLAEQYLKAASDLSPVRSNRRLHYIEFKAQTGQPDEARKALDEVTRTAPDYLPAWILGMKLAFDEKRYDDCEAAIQQILARDPLSYDALGMRGGLKRIRGDLEGAITDLRKAEGYYTHDLQIKYQLALAYLQKGDIPIARNILNEILVLAPTSEPPVLMLADIDIRTGHPASAVSSLSAWLKSPSPAPRAYLMLAQAELALKEPDQAMAIYRKMAAAFPKDPQPDYLIAMMMLGQKHPEEARQSLQKSIAIVPTYGPAVERIIDLDLQDKNYAAAEERVQALMQKYPATGAPWVFQAKIDLAQHHVPTAESDLQKAIDKEPKREESYRLLADLYLSANQAQQALDSLTALTAKSDSIPALMEIGMIQTRLKHYDAVAAAYQRILKLQPRYVPALNNLAYLYSEDLGKVDQGYALAKQAHDIAPDEPSSTDTLGWILYRRGDYRNALTLLEDSAEKTPNDPEIRYHEGMAHYMLGEEDSARLGLEAAVVSTSSFPEKEDATRRLTILAIDVKTADAKVKADLAKRVAAEPGDLVALVRLAEIQKRDGEAGPAAANFAAALKLNPRSPDILLELSQLDSGTLHHADQALALAQNAHELAPTDPAIAHTLGRLFYEQGDYARSLSLLQDVAEGSSDQPDLVYDLARDQYSAGRISEAEATVAKVLQSAAPFSRREEAKSFADMVAASKNPTQAQAAAAEAKKLLKADPANIAAQMVLGLAQEQQGNYPAARQIYEKILDSDRLFTPAIRQLALLYAEKLGDDGKAYDLATKARESYPDDAELAGVLGIMDYRRADYVGAANLFQESLKKKSDDPEMLYYLGMAHYQMKETSESKSELQRALDLNVSEQEAVEARRALADLNGGFQGPSLSAQPIN